MTHSFRDLTPDQINGAAFLSSRRVSMLADVPGLGKTAQIVHGFDLASVSRGLIICPPILRDNIAREFQKWSYLGRDVFVMESATDALPRDGTIAVSYHLARKPEIAKRLRNRGADWLVCDEAHAMKDPVSAQAKAIIGPNGIAHNVSRMSWLTGTPMPNNAGELYTFAKASGIWSGSQTSFISEFCDVVRTRDPYAPGGWKEKPVGARNVELLKQLLAPVYLRRTEVAGLPSLRVDVLSVAGSARAVDAATDDETRAAIIAAADADDWQFFDTPHIASIRRLAGLAKAPAAADLIVTELDGGEPHIVVFAYHRAVVELLHAEITRAGFSCGVIDGRSGTKKTALIDQFQAGELRALIVQTQSGGEGITLTRAARAIVAEPSWTPKDNGQCIARVHRTGQKIDVRASLIALCGSIDSIILQTLERKKKIIDAVI